MFQNGEKGADNVIVMFKAGDDLRQDTMVLQLLQVMDEIWKANDLDLCLSTYRCVPTWHDGGMLEIVRNSATTAEIHKKYGGAYEKEERRSLRCVYAVLCGVVYCACCCRVLIQVFPLRVSVSSAGTTGAFKSNTFSQWIKDNNPDPHSETVAIDKFVRSCAGYCVATFVMGIGDRHNDNIMVKVRKRRERGAVVWCVLFCVCCCA